MPKIFARFARGRVFILFKNFPALRAGFYSFQKILAKSSMAFIFSLIRGEVLIVVLGVGTFADNSVAVAGLINTASINTFREIRDTKNIDFRGSTVHFRGSTVHFPYFFAPYGRFSKRFCLINFNIKIL